MYINALFDWSSLKLPTDKHPAVHAPVMQSLCECKLYGSYVYRWHVFPHVCSHDLISVYNDKFGFAHMTKCLVSQPNSDWAGLVHQMVDEVV